MNTIITPAEVATLAFGADPTFDTALICESTIAVAEEKFIRPVLGKLFEGVASGKYPHLSEEYIKPCLAVYVKLLMLPQMAVKTGNSGLTQFSNGLLDPPSAQAVRDLRQSLRHDADILMHRAVNHIEGNLGDFPEYDPQENVLNYVSVKGDILF